jgi:hypothetical protein
MCRGGAVAHARFSYRKRKLIVRSRGFDELSWLAQTKPSIMQEDTLVSSLSCIALVELLHYSFRLTNEYVAGIQF